MIAMYPYYASPAGDIVDDLERELKRSFWSGLLAGLGIAGVVYLYKRRGQ